MRQEGSWKALLAGRGELLKKATLSSAQQGAPSLHPSLILACSKLLSRDAGGPCASPLIAAAPPGPCQLKAMAASGAQQGPPPSALWTAAAEGDEATVRELLRQPGINLEAGHRTMHGTALCPAAFFGHSSVVELLLQAGASVNARRIDETPLHSAAASGRAAVARRLIAAGANLNAQNNRGVTPLHCALLSGTLEMVKLLVDAGADIYSITHDNETVLHMAANSSEPGLVPYLLEAEAGCYVNSKTISMQLTPLMVACTAGNKAGAVHLLEAGAEVGAKTDQGGTALHFAPSRGHRDIVALLIAAGADMMAVTHDGHTSVDYAMQLGYGRVAALLHAAAAAREGGRQAGATSDR